MHLTDEEESELLRAARTVPERERDAFFHYTASLLRPIRDLRLSDVRHAYGAALVRYGRHRPAE